MTGLLISYYNRKLARHIWALYYSPTAPMGLHLNLHSYTLSGLLGVSALYPNRPIVHGTDVVRLDAITTSAVLCFN